MAIGVTDHKWTLEELLTFRALPHADSIIKGKCRTRQTGTLGRCHPNLLKHDAILRQMLAIRSDRLQTSLGQVVIHPDG
jgi:hypothetical protein